MQDDRGLELSSRNGPAVVAFNNAVRSFLEYRVTAMPLAKEAATLDPEFCMAHCLRGYFFMVFGTFAVLDKARAALAEAESALSGATPREMRHVQALRSWVEGDLVRASATWERILFDDPLDLLALRLHHFNSFWMGQARALRAAPASVLTSWTEQIPGYGHVLGMLAFGFEENGEYAEAERYGRRAVEIVPDDLWALHSVAHVLEMQGRNAEGQIWLSQPLDKWDDRNPFKRHLWWHLALFLLDERCYDAALDLYDRAVLGEKSGFYLDIQNAASLLVRLEFSGVDVGHRWKALAEYARAHIDDHALVFTDIHCVIALARSRSFEEARRLVESMRTYAADRARYASKVIDDLGIPLSEAIIAFEEGRYKETVDRILPLRHVTGPVGASHAQRDIFDQYLLEAALRGGVPRVAQGLLQERRLLKPNSRETEAKVQRFRTVA
jgi:tetratricopeptide (TPR) repeat protein